MVQGGLCRPYTCQLCDRESRLACLIIRRRSRVCHSRFITRVVGLINAWGQFHDERDKVKINKCVYFHCKLMALTQTVLHVLGKNILILLANLFS